MNTKSLDKVFNPINRDKDALLEDLMPLFRIRHIRIMHAITNELKSVYKESKSSD